MPSSNPAATVGASVNQRAAAWITHLRWDDIPAPVIEATRLQILDLVGVMLASHDDPLLAQVRNGLRDDDPATSDGRGGAARALGSAAPWSLANAAMLNGVMAALLEFDDTHIESSIHATSAALAAALPAAQLRRASGRELILAVLVGNELSCRLGLVSRARLYSLGIHPTGVFGVFGAAWSLARVLQLPAAAITHALGICGSMSAALMGSWEDGTAAKSLHVGLAASDAVKAVYLARQGVTGPAGVFDGRFNWYRAHVQAPGAQFDFARLTEGLGSEWETLNIASKAYPSAFPIHPYVDAALILRARHAFALDDIVSIECPISAARIATLCEPLEEKLRPATAWQARVSLQHSIAEALVTGKADRHAYGPDLLADPGIQALARRVTYIADEQISDATRSGGRVSITLADGQKLEHTITHMRGTRDNPFTRADFVAKFRSNTDGLLTPATQARALENLLDLDRVSDVAEVFDQITVSGTPHQD